MTLVYALDHRHELSPEALLALVGGKAANLGVMARDLGLPVPPGFVITTDACRTYLAGGWPAELDAEVRAAMSAVEGALGRRFGDPNAPLLVSVRSGAPVSMPGMMDTILDLGVTAATEAGLARTGGGAAFARDCRERLAAQFQALVGAAPPDDPWQQLRSAVEAVFRSWNGDRAKAYRQRESIPDDLGTAATVQAMVFGNRDTRSGTGVFFTRNPATGERTPYGDVLFGAQGEDVVAGTHHPEPIAVLDERLPDVADELRAYGDRLEHRYADMCDIEFTIESGKLWMLQVRVGKRSPQAALRMAVEMADDPGFPLTREDAVRRVLPLLANPPVVAAVAGAAGAEPVANGLAASPGIASGEIVTSPEEAVRLADEGRTVILVRTETSPDDVHGMAKAAGILTAQGGIASHAAVVARGWGIPAVVGVSNLSVGDGAISVYGVELRSRELLTIDGSTGAVYRGRVEISTEVVPAARTLLKWADELGIPIAGAAAQDALGAAGGEAKADAPPPSPAQARPGSATPPDVSRDDVLHLVGVKGFGTPQAVSEALRADPSESTAMLDGLVGDGLAVASGGAYRLTDRGVQRRAELVAQERQAIPADVRATLLGAFAALDGRMKEIVTAWQMRESGPRAEPVLNDHADADYDRGVLDRLESLASDADSWLADLADWPRSAAYRARLTRALDLAVAGDPRYVASPRVDSYHGVWFELHEELIGLAGSTRAEEVAAGRA